MRFRLRTLMIVLAIGPSLCALPLACPCVKGQTLARIQPGMTRDEVIAIAGRPASKTEMGDGELWEYHIAEFWPTAFLNPECVRFDRLGRVEATWVQ